MRALKLSALLLLVPTSLFAWGGYYGNRQPRKKSSLGGSNPQATNVQPSGIRSLAGGGGSGLTSPSSVGVSANSTAGTAVSTAPAPGSSSGFSTQVRSFADFGSSASGNNNAQAAQAAQPAAPTSAQLGSLMGSLGGGGAAALGGAGLGGALGAGGCPANMHSVANANGGQNCVPGAGQ